MSASQEHARDLPRGSSILSNRVKEAARGLLAPLVRLAGRLGITPNGVTVIGFFVVVVAAGLVAAGNLLIGAAVLVGGAVFLALQALWRSPELGWIAGGLSSKGQIKHNRVVAEVING